MNTVHAWIVYHVASGHAFFSGIALIQLAALLAFAPRTRLLTVSRVVLAIAGAILVAVSSTPLPPWFYGAASLITLASIIADCAIQTKPRRLAIALSVAMFGIWWLGIALELPYQRAHALPRLSHAQMFLIGDSLSAGINGERETWPKLLSRSHDIVITDLSRSGADTAEAMRQAEKVITSRTPALVLVEIGGNDVLRGYNPEAFEQALDALLAKLSGEGRTVVMFELPLPPFHNRFGEAQRRQAQRHAVILLPKRLLMGILTTSGATVDSIHLSARGHKLMANAVWEIVGPAIRR